MSKTLRKIESNEQKVICRQNCEVKSARKLKVETPETMFINILVTNLIQLDILHPNHHRHNTLSSQEFRQRNKLLQPHQKAAAVS